MTEKKSAKSASCFDLDGDKIDYKNDDIRALIKLIGVCLGNLRGIVWEHEQDLKKLKERLDKVENKK